MKQEIRILVTAIGTINGSAVVEELKNDKTHNFYVIGANSTPKNYVVTSRFVDEYYTFPSAIEDQEAYLEYVLSFCKEHNISHIICFIDEEVASFTKNRDRFNAIGVTLCLADYALVHTCHYKNIFSAWIKDNMPELWIKEYQGEEKYKVKEFPVFVKPIEGRASIGCKAIESLEDYKAFLKETNKAADYLVQEKVSGDIVGVDIIRNRQHGQTTVIQKKELVRNSNGCGTVVEIINDPRIQDACFKLAEKLDLNGVVNAEFFLTQSGLKIIEINPRLPAGTSYSCLAGGNTVINAFLIAEGQPCVCKDISIGKVYARRYETYEM